MASADDKAARSEVSSSGAQEPAAAKTKSSKHELKPHADALLATSPGRVEQLAPKRKGRRLSSEMFAVGAVDPSAQKMEVLEATADQPSCVQEIRQTMKQLLEQTRSFIENQGLLMVLRRSCTRSPLCCKIRTKFYAHAAFSQVIASEVFISRSVVL